jgi:hypothetical protein
LREAKELLMVGCFCIGTNQVDLKYALSRGIPVFNSPFSNSRSVAELIIGLIVALARKLGDVSMKMHSGTWFKSADNCHEVRGKTVGIIGYGHVGSQVSVLAESMGMKVLFYDIVPKMPLGSAVSCHTVDDVLREADFVTLHVPETDTTKNMIGAAQLASMRKGSYLLNYSRGTVVDLDALAAALKSGHLQRRRRRRLSGGAQDQAGAVLHAAHRLPQHHSDAAHRRLHRGGAGADRLRGRRENSSLPQRGVLARRRQLSRGLPRAPAGHLPHLQHTRQSAGRAQGAQSPVRGFQHCRTVAAHARSHRLRRHGLGLVDGARAQGANFQHANVVQNPIVEVKLREKKPIKTIFSR